MDPPPPLTPGAEDVAPDEIAAAAHRLLSRLADLLDAMEGGEGDVAFLHTAGLRPQLDTVFKGASHHQSLTRT